MLGGGVGVDVGLGVGLGLELGPGLEPGLGPTAPLELNHVRLVALFLLIAFIVDVGKPPRALEIRRLSTSDTRTGHTRRPVTLVSMCRQGSTQRTATASKGAAGATCAACPLAYRVRWVLPVICKGETRRVWGELPQRADLVRAMAGARVRARARFEVEGRG